MQSELTIHDYIDQLFADKQLLYQALYDFGYRDIANTDTFSILVPKVVDCYNFAFNQEPTLTETGTNMNESFLSSKYLRAAPTDLFVADSVTSLNSQCAYWPSDTAPLVHANNVTGMTRMFASSQNMQSVDLTYFSYKKITNAFAAFYGCSSLRYIQTPDNEWPALTVMNHTFSGTPIREIHMQTPVLNNLEAAFYGCWKTLTEDTTVILDLDITNVTTLYEAFRAAGPNTSNQKRVNFYIDCSSWHNTKTCNMGWAFLDLYNCVVDLRSFDFTKTSGSTWFSWACKLTIIVADATQKAALKSKYDITSGSYGYGKIYTVEEWEALQNG